MKQLLISMAEYNVWANRRIIDMLNEQPEDVIDAEAISSFPSIRKTIYHMWDAQMIWLNRLQGISLSRWPSDEYDAHFSGYDVYFIRHSEDLMRFIETRTESYFDSTCFYKALNGKEFHTSNWKIILHCLNHSTYHRGQIITMMRNLGKTNLVQTDYIIYQREKEEGII